MKCEKRKLFKFKQKNNNKIKNYWIKHLVSLNLDQDGKNIKQDLYSRKKKTYWMMSHLLNSHVLQ